MIRRDSGDFTAKTVKMQQSRLVPGRVSLLSHCFLLSSTDTIKSSQILKSWFRVNNETDLYHKRNTPRKLSWCIFPTFSKCHSATRPRALASNTKCDFFVSLPRASYLKSDLCSGVLRLHACPWFLFSPPRFYFTPTVQRSRNSRQKQSLNVESQSSVCPIPINYFTSPKSSAGSLYIPLKRGHTAGWQRPLNMAGLELSKTVKISRNHRLLIGRGCAERHTTIAGPGPRSRRGQRRNDAAFACSD